jgi:hypothetical protein
MRDSSADYNEASCAEARRARVGLESNAKSVRRGSQKAALTTAVHNVLQQEALHLWSLVKELSREGDVDKCGVR